MSGQTQVEVQNNSILYAFEQKLIIYCNYTSSSMIMTVYNCYKRSLSPKAAVSIRSLLGVQACRMRGLVSTCI